MKIVNKQYDDIIEICRNCHGTGSDMISECEICGGTGRIIKSKTVTIKIRPYVGYDESSISQR